MLENGIDESLELLSMIEEENDESMLVDVQNDLDRLLKKLEELEFRRMFSGKMDANNAWMDIQAGSGGTEAQHRAKMRQRLF